MTVSEADVRQLIEQCQGLVRSLALTIHRRLPRSVELDDLIAYGQVGLGEAARDFDASRGIRFSTFAYYRVRGAIYDGVAKMSWFGRSQQAAIRYEQMSHEVLRLEGEEPKASEEAGQENDLRWFRDVSRALAVVYLASQAGSSDEGGSDIEASLVDKSTGSASSVIIGRELIERLHQIVEQLPTAARELIRAIYFEGVTLQEAGKRLGVSKSWASRLHARAIQELARSLRAEGLGE